MKTKSKKSHSASSTAFAALARRLKHWRATRRRGHRIPEELWNAATRLARLHGLNPTASALKLNYYDLQRRLREASLEAPNHAIEPAFVELPHPAGVPTQSGSGSLELTRPCGARLSLCLPAIPSHDLQALVQAFLRS